jgi:hypothetical protein
MARPAMNETGEVKNRTTPFSTNPCPGWRRPGRGVLPQNRTTRMAVWVDGTAVATKKQQLRLAIQQVVLSA